MSLAAPSSGGTAPRILLHTEQGGPASPGFSGKREPLVIGTSPRSSLTPKALKVSRPLRRAPVWAGGEPGHPQPTRGFFQGGPKPLGSSSPNRIAGNPGISRGAANCRSGAMDGAAVGGDPSEGPLLQARGGRLSHDDIQRLFGQSRRGPGSESTSERPESQGTQAGAESGSSCLDSIAPEDQRASYLSVKKS